MTMQTVSEKNDELARIRQHDKECGMFGVTIETMEYWVQDALQKERFQTKAAMAISILSDAQELMELATQEVDRYGNRVARIEQMRRYSNEARQAINRAKWLIAQNG
jgi:hypothetical protein